MLSALRHDLLAWYRRHRRDLPWRRTRDPYAIWVSEIMLQQTQVDTVVPRYAPFLDEFPTVQALAKATEERVCEAWAGLGYYRRARNLHKGARYVVNELGGVMPSTAKELIELPGVGRYTAGAIASIAYSEAAPLVDGNVIRVFARLFAIAGRADEPVLVKRAWQIAEDMVAGEAPGDFNQALMELGATVCTPVAPLCLTCPVRKACEAHKTGEPTRFPEKSQAAKTKPLAVAFALVRDKKGILLVQRPLSGLWAGLWEPPSASGPKAKAELQELLGVPLGKKLTRVRHQLTHRDVTADVYDVVGKPTCDGRYMIDPMSAPLSALARKALVAALNETVR